MNMKANDNTSVASGSPKTSQDGGSVAIMIHPYDIAGARPLGETGLFVGGFSAAFDLVNRGGAQAKDFKFFFNHMAWPEGALEEQVRSGRHALRASYLYGEHADEKRTVGSFRILSSKGVGRTCHVGSIVTLRDLLHPLRTVNVMCFPLKGAVYQHQCSACARRCR